MGETIHQNSTSGGVQQSIFSSTMRFVPAKPCNIRRPRHLKIYITPFYEKTVFKYQTSIKVLVLRLVYF